MDPRWPTGVPADPKWTILAFGAQYSTLNLIGSGITGGPNTSVAKSFSRSISHVLCTQAPPCAFIVLHGLFMLGRRDGEGRLLLSNLMYPFSKPYLLASHMHVERYRVGLFSAVHCFKT